MMLASSVHGERLVEVERHPDEGRPQAPSAAQDQARDVQVGDDDVAQHGQPKAQCQRPAHAEGARPEGARTARECATPSNSAEQQVSRASVLTSSSHTPVSVSRRAAGAAASGATVMGLSPLRSCAQSRSREHAVM